jgi:hypothetical protein
MQVRAALVVQVRPPGVAMTVYPVMGEPPVDAGAAHDTVT